MAAGQASSSGANTLLLEKMDSPARKLLLTGKHRCNLTNTAPIEESLKEFNRDGKFLTQLFYRFYNQELRDFFESCGVPTVEQRGGRVFPASEDAREVVAALLKWAKETGLTIKTGTSVKEITIKDQKVSAVISDREPILLVQSSWQRAARPIQVLDLLGTAMPLHDWQVIRSIHSGRLWSLL